MTNPRTEKIQEQIDKISAKEKELLSNLTAEALYVGLGKPHTVRDDKVVHSACERENEEGEKFVEFSTTVEPGVRTISPTPLDKGRAVVATIKQRAIKRQLDKLRADKQKLESQLAEMEDDNPTA